MRLQAGFDPAGLNRLADDFEVDAFPEKNARTHRSSSTTPFWTLTTQISCGSPACDGSIL
jgi:hypothetical protein